MKYIFPAIALLVNMLLLNFVFGTPHAPTVPMAPGAHEGVQNATTHWRLVAETDEDGYPKIRRPYNAIRYTSPNDCAADGSKVPGPPKAHDNIDYLIRCLPYHGEDTDTETPIN